ncbi:MAG: flagellar motor protein MotA [Alphaproteobacteria bacterium]|uniref:flagellar motor protein MotA n=1 Tax=Pacificispira sp. TaxID=2888761 RepID=UPI001B2D0C33|nr:flagellar motor protein MotA [Alphaproteobacteria bacterium]MBO6862300.1 flagellar motor protein MotA [Alphaproteobacteria bacterium]MEC9266066.1 flagellar motor protein MotA [Pseudomonadota bacterium]
MSTPTPFLLRMGIFLVLVVIGCFLIYPALEHAFLANAVINGVILGVLLIGIVHAFRTVASLYAEMGWIQRFRLSYEGGYQTSERAPRLMASAATMLSKRSERGQLHISAGGMQTILDGVATRLDESRETGRYMVGLLVFLGLLGTFWGLLETVRSVGGVISGLDLGTDNVAGAFENLKQGLQTPLGGMGTAFSSSLFGLAGSLMLGFLALQAGQAQNRFYNELEEWLSGLTRLGSGSIGGDGDQSVPAYIQALLEQTADSLESLQRTMARAEENRLSSQNDFSQLNDKLSVLVDTMRTEHDLMMRLAEGQKGLRDALTKVAEGSKSAGSEEATRALKHIDQNLVRMIEENARGRAETVQELRSELRILARTVAALREGGNG